MASSAAWCTAATQTGEQVTDRIRARTATTGALTSETVAAEEGAVAADSRTRRDDRAAE